MTWSASRWETESDADVVHLLLRHGADTDAGDSLQTTALMEAAISGHAEVVALLPSYGADASLTDDEGKTALFYAEINQHTDVVTVLKAQEDVV